MKLWELKELENDNNVSFYNYTSEIVSSGKSKKVYRNYINRRRENFIVSFVICDYYTNVCLLKDDIVIRTKNMNTIKKYRLENLIQKRYYPIKIGKVKILDIRRG